MRADVDPDEFAEQLAVPGRPLAPLTKLRIAAAAERLCADIVHGERNGSGLRASELVIDALAKEISALKQQSLDLQAQKLESPQPKPAAGAVLPVPPVAAERRSAAYEAPADETDANEHEA